MSSLVRDGVQDVREIQFFISNCTTIHFFHGNKFCIKVHSVLVAFHKKLGCWLRFSKGETEHISKTMYSWECTNHVLQLPNMDELFFVKRSCYDIFPVGWNWCKWQESLNSCSMFQDPVSNNICWFSYLIYIMWSRFKSI